MKGRRTELLTLTNHMNMKKYISFLLCCTFLAFNSSKSLCQVYQQNKQIAIQQNQQNVNINVPVIEKKVYVDRFRTVYVDRPQPKRVARKLSAPFCLHGYLWVYTEDIGNFKNQADAWEIIQNINVQAPFGRNTWRIPTSAELAVLEQNADKVGLGEDIYLATDHRNGVLRMVSTGPTAAERKAEADKLAMARRIQEEEVRRRAEQQRRQQETKLAIERQQQADAARIKAEEQRKAEQIRQRILEEEYRKQMAAEELKQQTFAEERRADAAARVTINGITWATRNVSGSGTFVSSVEMYGGYFTHMDAASACPAGWRLPTESEMRQLYSLPKKEDTVNGVKGTRFGVGANSVFLPIAGAYGYDGTFSSSTAVYWSGTSSSKYNIYYLNIKTGYYGGVMKREFSGSNKRVRYPVRCVRK